MTEKVDLAKSMESKVVLITGGTGGIGKATAEGLARLGATLNIVGRDEKRGAEVVVELRASTNNPKIEFLSADMSSQVSIRQLANTFEAKYPRLDVLINNVGGIFEKRQETIDGIETTFALNHLAAFLLSTLLLNQLKASSSPRIINVNAASLGFTRLNFDDLQSVKQYKPLAVYGRAKLANLLFTYELAQKLRGSGITVNAVNPGGADTPLSRSAAIPWYLRAMGQLMAKFVKMELAARTQVYLASSPEVAGVTGKYFNSRMRGVNSSKASYDQISAQRLWEVSSKLISNSLF